MPWTKAAGAQRSHVGHLRAADSNATGERVLGESEMEMGVCNPVTGRDGERIR